MSEYFHIPGRPRTPKPSSLPNIAASIQHPDIVRTGITTTKEGDWAILVVVKNGTHIPIKEIEAESQQFPVIYQEDTGSLPIARPAYPLLGE